VIINIALELARFQYFPDQTILFHIAIFVQSTVVFILGWEVLILMHKYFETIFSAAKNPAFRICLQIFLTTIIFILLSLTLVWSADFFFGVPPAINNIFYLLNFLVAVIFNLTLFGTQYFYHWKRNLVSKTNLEKEQAVVKYDALRNQLNPHFLFNALTSLNSLIFENQQLASDFLQQLSKVYRYTLQNRNNKTVSVRTELNFMENYISLLETRFGEAIAIKIAVDKNDLDKGIAPVVSQVLIENAVKHNMVCLDCPLNILISSDNNYFIVENNRTHKTNVESSNKLGMENLKELYQYLSESPIEIEDFTNRYTVKIPLIQ
jgi:sensor histidine kinase YesM